MFYCEHYRCTMAERHCVHYQAAVQGGESAALHFGNAYGQELTVDRGHCVNCPQGRRVAANYKPALCPAGLPGRSEHIQEPYRSGPLPAIKEEKMPINTCLVPACGKPVVAQGLCSTHYDKWRRGDPETIKLMGGEFKIIRHIKRKGPIPVEAGYSPRSGTKPIKPPPRYPDGPGPSKVNGQIQVPDFETKVLYVVARQSGTTITESFLRCLRRGIEAELGAM